MRSLLRKFLIFVIAFTIGSAAAPPTYVRTTLEDITANPSGFHETLVEVETFAQWDLVFESWTIGEPFEKEQVLTFLDLSTDSQPLRGQLVDGITEDEYPRVKVIARGRVRDNCAAESGIITCCFGRSITLLEAEIRPIGSIERYKRPRY
jgi:hypothetical protein